MVDKLIAGGVAAISAVYAGTLLAGNEPSMSISVLDQFLISFFALMWAFRK